MYCPSCGAEAALVELLQPLRRKHGPTLTTTTVTPFSITTPGDHWLDHIDVRGLQRAGCGGPNSERCNRSADRSRFSG